MSDAIAIQPHADPWLPSPDSELVTTYDRYNVPLIGHLRQHGDDYVFWCVEGVMAEVGLWAYVLVRPAELAVLEEADDFDAAFAKVTAGQPVVLAIASEGRGITNAMSIDHPHAFDSLVEAARSEIRELNRTFSREPTAASC